MIFQRKFKRIYFLFLSMVFGRRCNEAYHQRSTDLEGNE